MHRETTDLRSTLSATAIWGYYYFVKEDVANSKTYWEKILAIDPEHEVAKRALEAMK